MLSTGMGPLKAAVGVADAAPMYFGGLQWEAAISAIGDLFDPAFLLRGQLAERLSQIRFNSP